MGTPSLAPKTWTLLGICLTSGGLSVLDALGVVNIGKFMPFGVEVVAKVGQDKIAVVLSAAAVVSLFGYMWGAGVDVRRSADKRCADLAARQLQEVKEAEEASGLSVDPRDAPDPPQVDAGAVRRSLRIYRAVPAALVGIGIVVMVLALVY
jgi:hypothetical protein